VQEVRESTKGLLVLDAGDLLFKKSPTPYPENEMEMVKEKASLIVKCFSLMGYDALGIGDDDLNLGKEFLLAISKKANFPFLSSNLMDEGSGKNLFTPYVLKEVNGLRIGIFSLLSPDFFRGQGDPRGKGVVLRPPVEIAQDMVRELQPKTDLIILLSHLGYNKDIELVQKIKGIHLVIGGHTGINLAISPPPYNTIILQTVSKGMYAGRVNLTWYNHEQGFYDLKNRQFLEHNLKNINLRLSKGNLPEAEKSQWLKMKEGVERNLKQIEGKNEFTNSIVPLADQIKDHPEIRKMVEAYRSKFPEPGKSQPSK
jgi:2',3'-cyclic-nucleotide 2'-phosphodiesterase (5'-nucleotidase family)